MKRALVALLVIVGASLLRFLTITVPQTQEIPALRTVRGAMHVHTDRSHDGHQSLEEVTKDAKAAGLDFVVITDHNTTLSAPRYDGTVLVVPAVELSQKEGHVIALGMSEASVKGAADKAVGDLWQQSVLLVGAHPDSPKHPIDDAALQLLGGYELLSTSSDFYGLVKSPRVAWLLGYLLRPRAALAALYPDRAGGITRYDRLEQKPLLACGVDDHGRVPSPLRLATYVTYLPSFIPERDAARDASELVQHLARRESYCALGLYGDASPLSVTVRGDGGLQTLGAEIAAPAMLRARWQGELPAGHRFYLYKDGVEILQTEAASFERSLGEPGRYRLELGRDVPTFFFGTRHVRWIYTNPIRVLPGAA